MTCVPRSQFASISLDRFFRLHVAYPPPADLKERPTFEKRGDNEKTPLKIFLKSTPTAIAWDSVLNDFEVSSNTGQGDMSDNQGADDDDWNGMDVVADEGGTSESDEEELSAAVRPRHR